MADSMTLRIKTEHGIETINGLTAASTFADLRSEVASRTKLPVESIKLLSGFPPKLLKVFDSSTMLGDLHLKSGETLIVEEDMSVRKAHLEKNYHAEVCYCIDNT